MNYIIRISRSINPSTKENFYSGIVLTMFQDTIKIIYTIDPPGPNPPSPAYHIPLSISLEENHISFPRSDIPPLLCLPPVTMTG